MVPVLCLLLLCCLKCQEGLSCLLPKESVGPRPPATGVGGGRSFHVPESRQQSGTSTRTTRVLEVEMVPALPSVAREDSVHAPAAAEAAAAELSASSSSASAYAPAHSAYVHNMQ